MISLVDFLLARITEDEETARAAEHDDGPSTLEWRRGGKRVLRFDNGRSEDYETVFAGNWDRIFVTRDSVRGGPLAQHIARQDPAKVLDDCTAKRHIVDAYRDERTRRDIYQSDDARAAEDEEQAIRRHSSAARCRGLEIALEALALPYADHPDFPSWEV